MRASLLALLLLLLLPSTSYATRVVPAGWDTCDESEMTEGGTAGVTTISTSYRTGRCALRVNPGSGQTGWASRAIAPADRDVYGRVYIKRLAPSTGEGLPLIGMWQGTSSTLGCHVDLEVDGSLSLGFKDRTTYQVLGRTPADFVTTGTYAGIELHQTNPASCSGSCTVTCEVWVDGFQTMSAANTGVIGATDFGNVSEIRVGALLNSGGTYDVAFDDFVADDAVQIGIGRVEPLSLNGAPGGAAWGSVGSAGDCNSGTGRWGCVNDFIDAAPATHDSDATAMDGASGDVLTLDLDRTVIASDETLKDVTVFSIAKSSVAGTARVYRLNLTDGTNTINGTNHSTTTTTYEMGAIKLSTTNPAGGAWDQSSLDNLKIQFEKISGNTNRVTAALVYADIKKVDPIADQNMQDWNNDLHLTLCFGLDSRIQGTGLGFCQNDASKTCSDNTECLPPFTASDVTPCSNTSKLPTVFVGLARQKISQLHPTTVLNCGIAANLTRHFRDRVPGLLSGVGGATLRFCRLGLFALPGTCVPTDPSCTSTTCASTDCFGGYCDLNCSVAIGSNVCSNDHTRDCVLDADCTGGGTCSDHPGCDYVHILGGVNDFHVTHNPECSSAAGIEGPCPGNVSTPASSATPALTPAPTATPGIGYGCRRTTCSASSECTFGRCTGDVSKACDTNGDCTGLGSCSSALAPSGDATCASGICTCPCASVPCTNDLDCGPGYYYDASGMQLALPQYGTCDHSSGAIGHCSGCGPVGCPGGATSARNQQWRRYRSVDSVVDVLKDIANMIQKAGSTVIWLSDPPIFHPCDSRPPGWTTNAGWAGAIDQLQTVRNTFYFNQPNMVDLWSIAKQQDNVLVNRRCSNDVTRSCVTSADCTGTGVSCQIFWSSWSPYIDPIHLGPNGASHGATDVYAYDSKLSPVCTGNPTIGCGRCQVTGDPCLSSVDCTTSTGRKCVFTDSVCTAASAGSCRGQRACNSTSSCVTHKLCTLSFARCTSDGDCGASGGVCRTEGHYSSGEAP